nr:RING-H2 finger protein ATL66-like [Ziziphus jujuba var. spinosa]
MDVWERLRGGLDESSRRNAFCPSGFHPDGSCSCESFLMTEESTTRASISRIVMLAEALFVYCIIYVLHILDEIHRQPVCLTFPDYGLNTDIVDSFPPKSHKKVDAAEASDDVKECYICLAEYKDGDKIRVLPCHHEYHMSCVDKWLKEIHGVCPLCRGDVHDGSLKCSVSNSEMPFV